MEVMKQSQLERQDFVDNSIYELLIRLNPTSQEIKWDIEIIGEIRDQIQDLLVNRLQLIDEKTFYP